MKIKQIIEIVEEIAPLHYAEDFDNVGLLVGDETLEVTNVLVTLDTTESVVQEAIDKKCNLIVSFHPIIFSGLKKLTGKTYVERAVLKAIQNNIALYAIHTALDNSFVGVNDKICERLGLVNRKILIPQPHSLQQLFVYVPEQNAETLRQALFAAGAGKIGDYDSCSYNIAGHGTYRALENANPVIGEIGELHTEKEIRIEVVVPTHLTQNILKAMRDHHPYEVIAFGLLSLQNPNSRIGMGMIGELEAEMDEEVFMDLVKSQMNTPLIRHSQLLGKKIKKVAVLGGSGAFAIKNAIAQGADAFISADFKYHDFFLAENRTVLMDIGHFESEQFTKNLLTAHISKKITNFVVFNSEIKSNPVNYY
ncbi:Nif3-like dinuclear metal center hexameric protein [Vaginella massiliensis]|uniref:Nif3-like dinuclear metal center hexameric protein n=1 Tax=Vaginella massiliensis TaxID=1816680 RepID=UPI0008380EEF|nr:Nif3-like dinuclear metal center hexameric protein [Vaginella massiliensis]